MTEVYEVVCMDEVVKRPDYRLYSLRRALPDFTSYDSVVAVFKGESKEACRRAIDFIERSRDKDLRILTEDELRDVA